MEIKLKKDCAVSTEKQVVRGCIWHDDFLKAVQDKPAGIFSADWSKRLFAASVKYYRKHKEAPKDNLLEYLRLNKEKFRIGEEEMKDIERVVGTIQPFDGKTSISFEVEKANRLFDEIILRETSAKIEDALDASNIELATKLVEESRTQLVKTQELGTGLKAFSDDSVKQLVLKAHEDEGQPLIPFRGAMGQLFNNFIRKRRFVAFLATAKAGKTWMLYNLALMAARYNVPVLLLGAGDEKEVDMANRLSHMASYNPMQFDANGNRLTNEYTAIREEDAGEYAFPVCDCLNNQLQQCGRNCPNRVALKVPVEQMMEVIDTPEKLFDALPRGYKACPHAEICPDCKPTWTYEMCKVVWRGEHWLADTAKKFGQHSKTLAFNTYNNGSLTIEEIRKNVEDYKTAYGRYPELVCIDYADIMAPERQSEGEARWDASRHGENRRWMRLKNLVDEYGFCLCTSTQSNRSGYDTTKVLTPENLNEDRRKADHVNVLYGLSSSPKERQFRIGRLYAIIGRGRCLNLFQHVHILTAMEGGRFWRDCFLRTVREDPKPKQGKN